MVSVLVVVLCIGGVHYLLYHNLYHNLVRFLYLWVVLLMNNLFLCSVVSVGTGLGLGNVVAVGTALGAGSVVSVDTGFGAGSTVGYTVDPWVAVGSPTSPVSCPCSSAWSELLSPL